MKVNADELRLYAVTDRSWLNGRTLVQVVEESLRGGATFLQLRDKNPDRATILQEASEIKALCKKYHVPFIINDDVELAIAVGADGVHVGQDDRPAKETRAMIGPDMILGVSTHNVQEAIQAQADGADYLGCGAAFPSGTKSNAGVSGVETIKQVASAVDIPVVAIGGITMDNLSQFAGSAVSGMAVVSAIYAQEDICAAAAALKDKIEQVLKG